MYSFIVVFNILNRLTQPTFFRKGKVKEQKTNASLLLVPVHYHLQQYLALITLTRFCIHYYTLYLYA